MELFYRVYYDSNIEYSASCCTLSEFVAYDDAFNKTAGIYELDKSMKHLQARLDDALKQIVNDEPVLIAF